MILNNIAFKLDMDKALEKLHIKGKDNYVKKFSDLVEDAKKITNPKVLYKEAYIEEKGEDYVVIENIKFNSRILAVNLKDNYKVYPFVSTCGKELENWSNSLEDIMDQFWADYIKQAALNSAREYFKTNIKENFNIEKYSQMNPGSLDDWPISEQKKLFQLLDNPYDSIGVELTESFLMLPNKTVSGIIFAADVDYSNCQLCPRENCPGRKAPYNEELYNERYKK
jgi:hypothetical protein